MRKEEMFDQLTKALADTLKKKNKDYGSAFDDIYNEIGFNYAYSKIKEKVNRIKTLKDNENAVENEGLVDALMDCAGYCILSLAKLNENEED